VVNLTKMHETGSHHLINGECLAAVLVQVCDHNNRNCSL